MAETSRHDLSRALVRFNAHVLGITTAAIATVGLFVATLVLVAQGGENPGPMLGLLRHFFPGYSVSVGGAFVGALWAAVAFYVLGALFGLAYGPWLLREAVPVTRDREGEDELGRSVALLPPLPVAVTTGTLLAVGLFASTNWLSFLAGAPNTHLGLLSQYFPGYTTSLSGSLIGAFWVFLYGFATAGCIAWIYNRIVAARFSRSERAERNARCR